MDRIRQIAQRQLRDLRALDPGTIFSDPGFRLTTDEAYAVQDEVTRLRCASGDEVAGYKVGCTGAAVRSTFGMDGPVGGVLFASEIHTSPAMLAHDRFAQLAVEAEVAVRIGRDGRPDTLFPVIELHHYVLRSSPPQLAELIADNAIQAGVVLGHSPWPPWTGETTGDIRLIVDDEVVDEGPAAGVPGGPMGSLRWLADHLGARGQSLLPGQIVLTGTPLGIYRVGPGSRIRAEADGLGSVEAQVV